MPSFMPSSRSSLMDQAFSHRPVHDLHEWQRTYASLPRPTLTQSLPYGEAKQEAAGWRVRRLLIEQAGKPVALCQVLERRLAGFRYLSRINRGPLFVEPEPSADTRRGVLSLLRRQWRLPLRGPLIIAPAIEGTEENRQLMKEAGFIQIREKGWCSALIDLRAEPDQILARLSSYWRNRLRAAQRSELRLDASGRREHVEWMLDRHLHNMKAKGFAGPTRKLVSALQHASPADFLVLRAMLDGEPVAGMAITRFGIAAEYYVGWFGDAGRKLNAGNFLYWNAVMAMKEAGCHWFDLGGYQSSDHYGRFKQGMRGLEYRYIGEWLAF